MNRKKHQKGSALVYILVAVALLAALTATFMDSSGQQTSSRRSAEIVGELKTQIEFIRSAIQECVLSYPNGDVNMPASPGGDYIPPATRAYPLGPYNTYLVNPTSASSLVKNIRCPGNPGDSNNHAKIFDNGGKFLPPVPAPFNGWHYYSRTDGVFMWIQTTASDAFVASALQKLDANYSKCETHYLDATSGVIHITYNNNPSFTCSAGNKCFLVHLVTTSSTIYPGETGCP